MDRNEVLEMILSIPSSNILCEMATGYGKSRIAIELLKKRKPKSVLIVVPRNVLKENWSQELKKWKAEGYNITYTTYVSLPKHAGEWDMVIFDECHHLSDRCREALHSFKIKSSILLSATVKRELKDYFKVLFKNLYCCKVDIKEAIKNNVLPNPRVYLLPMELDNMHPTMQLEINPKAKGAAIILPYTQIWKARKDKNRKYIITCTPRQYYNEISNKIEWYKRKAMGSNMMKTVWLRHCADRLKWLSDQKYPIIYSILHRCRKERTLTFCNSIEQTELLGEYCINSSNKDSIKHLSMFNRGKIDHITAVNMLNEGMNLSNCRIGIYANLNSSETIIKQRLGRILRHTSPIIIIPYFKRTRDEELVEKMLFDYDPELVTVINSVEELEI